MCFCASVFFRPSRRSLYQLTQLADPVNHAVNHTRAGAEDQNRPRNRKHLRAGSENNALCLKFHRRRSNGIRETRDRNKRSRAGKFCNIIIDRKACEQHRQKHQTNAGGRRTHFFVQSHCRCAVHHKLSQRADQSARPKGVEAVFDAFAFRRKRIGIPLIFFVGHPHAISPFCDSFPQREKNILGYYAHIFFISAQTICGHRWKSNHRVRMQNQTANCFEQFPYTVSSAPHAGSWTVRNRAKKGQAIIACPYIFIHCLDRSRCILFEQSVRPRI